SEMRAERVRDVQPAALAAVADQVRVEVTQRPDLAGRELAAPADLVPTAGEPRVREVVHREDPSGIRRAKQCARQDTCYIRTNCVCVSVWLSLVEGSRRVPERCDTPP